MPAPASDRISGSRFTALVALSAVLFFLSLVPTEAIPEIPVDIDFKPYFLPLLLVALLPVGRATLAVALGVALGEGLRDLMEGYEIDDPLGFVAYIVGFVVGGYVIGMRALNRAVLVLGSLACAGVQAVIEAASFLLFGEEGLGVAAMTALGNTITHGIVMGAIPLLLLVPVMHGRFERHLGFAPKGTPPPRRDLEELAAGEPAGDRAGDGLLRVQGLWFRYAGTEDPALRGITLAIRRGEVLGLLGPAGSGKSTLCLCLSGIAPRNTGGEILGRIALDGAAPTQDTARRIGLVTESAAAQLTQMRPVDEVASVLVNAGHEAAAAHRRAEAALRRFGFPEQLFRRRSWELSEGEQRLVVLAAALVADPDLLLFDGVAEELDAAGRARFRAMLEEVRPGKAVLLVENDPALLLALADSVAVMVEGRILRVGPAAEVLADAALLERAGYAPPAAPAPFLQPDATPETPAPDHEAPPAPQDAVLALRDIAFAYDEAPPALDGVTLHLAAGEVVALLGPHGAGKTTLGKVIAGLLAPDRGELHLMGREARALPLGERLGLVGLAMADPDQSISERSVRDEIALPPRRAGMPRAEAEARAAETLRRAGLPEALLDADPTALPLGGRKQVAIATALARAPRLLVLDEPVAGLDGTGRAALAGLVRRLAAEGVAVLILDHRTELAAELADRVVLLHRGRSMASLDAASLRGGDAAGLLRAAGLAPPMPVPDRSA